MKRIVLMKTAIKSPLDLLRNSLNILVFREKKYCKLLPRCLSKHTPSLFYLYTQPFSSKLVSCPNQHSDFSANTVHIFHHFFSLSIKFLFDEKDSKMLKKAIKIMFEGLKAVLKRQPEGRISDDSLQSVISPVVITYRDFKTLHKKILIPVDFFF